MHTKDRVVHHHRDTIVSLNRNLFSYLLVEGDQLLLQLKPAVLNTKLQERVNSIVTVEDTISLLPRNHLQMQVEDVFAQETIVLFVELTVLLTATIVIWIARLLFVLHIQAHVVLPRNQPRDQIPEDLKDPLKSRNQQDHIDLHDQLKSRSRTSRPDQPPDLQDQRDLQLRDQLQSVQLLVDYTLVNADVLPDFTGTEELAMHIAHLQDVTLVVTAVVQRVFGIQN